MRTAAQKEMETSIDTEPGTDTDTDTDTERVDATERVAPETDVSNDDGDISVEDDVTDFEPRRRRFAWRSVVAFGVLPTIALLLALGAGYAKWREASARDAQLAGIAAVQTAKDGTVALLAYQPDTVEKDLTVARDRLTGAFRESYTSLTDQVVIPGAQQQLIKATATVPGAALVSATGNHAVVLVFVNQTTTIGNGAPSDTASSVRVVVDKLDGKWLISGFDPV